MNKKTAIFLISSLLATNSVFANIGYSDMSDFTGDAFFTPASELEIQKTSGHSDGDTVGKHHSEHTTPPVKQLRMMLQEKSQEREYRKQELAPTSAKEVYEGEVDTSEYASKEIKDEFDDITPDGFEADDESINEAEKTKKGLFKRRDKKLAEKPTEDIILDCENIDYDTPNYTVYAKGNVNVVFVRQGITVKADSIIFDRVNNTVKAEGDVRIVKGSKVVTGDYIFVDMNEENALIENPRSESSNILIRADRGYVYGDKIVQENGTMTVEGSYPINISAGSRGPRIGTMLTPKNQNLTTDMSNGLIKLKAQEIRVSQKGDLETLALKRFKVSKGKYTLIKLPSIKFYTNKNHEYVEIDGWDVGYYRGLGFYTGPGWVFELPKASVLKLMPIFTYKSGAGFGGLGRFSSGTNKTIAGYGSSEDRFILLGDQKLDDNLRLHYAANAYMDEWFLGRRRPKYGVGLIYDRAYGSKNFLLKDKYATFEHRVDVGYYQNLDYDKHFEHIVDDSRIGTTRFRYMAMASQNFYKYEDVEKLKAFKFDLVSQLSAALYGTGDTQLIGRLGPRIHMQYKNWMQDIGYYFSAYDDNSPFKRFDAYRYGKQNISLRETFRINRYLALSWLGSFNVSNDAPNHKSLQENSFYLSVGPDDFKFSVGYDFVRENMYCNFEVMMDAKGANVEYDRFEITQEKKAEKKPKKETKVSSRYIAPTEPKVLKNAVVEDIKVMEDVL